jgi:hypothetical protein
MSEASSIKLYQVNGQDETVVMSIPMLTWFNSPPDFHMWGSLKNVVYCRKHRLWRHYGKKMKRRVPLSQWTPWSRWLVH